MSVRLACAYCRASPLFRNTSNELVCDVHQKTIPTTQQLPRQGSMVANFDAIETLAAAARADSMVANFDAMETLAAAARAAVSNLAFVAREEVTADKRIHQ